MNDLDITTLVSRLGRPNASGGIVIERAAIQAAGADYSAVVDWILAHSGKPEGADVSVRNAGLHGSRILEGSAPGVRAPLRFVLPAAALE